MTDLDGKRTVTGELASEGFVSISEEGKSGGEQTLGATCEVGYHQKEM